MMTPKRDKSISDLQQKRLRLENLIESTRACLANYEAQHEQVLDQIKKESK